MADQEPRGQEPAAEVSAVVSLADFEPLAEARLERPLFDYIAGGSGDELTLAENATAFRRWRLLPRVMRDVSAIDTGTTFLGNAVGLPVGIAPMAFQHFAHPDAEAASARAAARHGVLYCLSTMSSRSLEEVAAAAREVGPARMWFQLYVHRDRGRSEDLVRRAEAAGYSAIVVTVDFPVAGIRERDLRNRLPYPQVFGNFDFRARDEPAPGTERLAGETLAATIGGFNDASLSWTDLAWLRSLTSLPIVIKGILAPSDARLAVDHGASALIVSNHGGRQLDRAPATIDALPGIVETVSGRAEVYLDGGVRRGADVLIALALGARGVFVGRPIAYALAVGGEAGVARALAILEDGIRTDMALVGVRRLNELGPDCLFRS